MDNFNGINISEDLLKSVRQEYVNSLLRQAQQPQQQQQIQPKNFGRTAANGITVEVLENILLICKYNPTIFQIIESLQQEQDQLEKDLFNERQRLITSHSKKRDEMNSKKILKMITDKELSEFESDLELKLKEFDENIVHKGFLQQINKQQLELAPLLPLFYKTLEKDETETQQKIIQLILDMKRNQ